MEGGNVDDCFRVSLTVLVVFQLFYLAKMSVWHCQHITFNPGTSFNIRIASTYAFPAMEQAFRLRSGTDEHTHGILSAACGFRYAARRDTAGALRSILRHDYLIIPLHFFNMHWAVAIVTHAPNLLPENRTNGVAPTYIYTLDSLEGDTVVQSNARQVIRSWLMFCVNSHLAGNVRGTDIVGVEIVQVSKGPCHRRRDPHSLIHHFLDRNSAKRSRLWALRSPPRGYIFPTRCSC